MDPSDRERLIVLEAILLRIEKKFDEHLKNDERRFGRLERALSYVKGIAAAFSMILSAILIYLKFYR